ncbi:hypothetical protein [Gordonia crocea]|uniref:Uncharacterized protein n=1 Tax=Gordonia crocea TaxID=589162 RepID=A0A7I9V0G4_9ACTN|nr:hypothetical protein [Gordonia crocea]GED98676.1 hypothetical protein nbrc107697_27150 [Gordonia crocea]
MASNVTQISYVCVGISYIEKRNLAAHIKGRVAALAAIASVTAASLTVAAVTLTVAAVHT